MTTIVIDGDAVEPGEVGVLRDAGEPQRAAERLRSSG